MAAQITNQAGIFIGNGGSFQQAMAKARTAWRSYRQYRATAAMLRALSERDLEDIGLAGRDLKTVAWTSVYGV